LGGVTRRAAAVASLALAIGATAFAVFLAIDRFPRGAIVLVCLAIALVAGWMAMRRDGVPRIVAATAAGAAIAGALLTLILLGSVVVDGIVIVTFVLSLVCARAAFRVHVDLPPAPRPERPVLFFNPLSGGGKARRFHLADEARQRGIEPLELGPGVDLRDLVEGAVKRGADALAMAGGDGSQAIVAEIAAREGLPYACIPSGTRNHFALDLGVDRDDVVGALDALVDGAGERRVDLAEVNGRVFVNNVSIGLYANAVQRPGYRDAKLRTLVEEAPAELREEAAGNHLRWRGPDGEDVRDAVALLVSNNAYRLGMSLGSGTRPHLDEGVLGIASATGGVAAHAPVRLRTWSSPHFELEADGPVAAGIDGEAATLDAPIVFHSKPAALTVRIAAGHPGHSPSTAIPFGLRATVAELFRIAFDTHRTDTTTNNDTDTREDPTDEQLRGRAPRDPHPR
jgi:diacylglycerol kinase family enzyme